MRQKDSKLFLTLNIWQTYASMQKQTRHIFLGKNVGDLDSGFYAFALSIHFN